MSALFGVLGELDAATVKTDAKVESLRGGGLRSSVRGRFDLYSKKSAIPPEVGILPFPYVTLLRELLEKGRIWEARNLLEIAGDAVPQDSKIREALAPPRIKKSPEKGFDRSAEFNWLKTKAAAYRGKWVALLDEQLLASADSLRDLLSKVRAIKPERKPLIHRID
jgi:hypothetical protein